MYKSTGVTMLEVLYEANSSQFVVTSPRCGTVRFSYAGRVQRYDVVSDSEFLVVGQDGTEERFSDAGFILG